MRVEAVGQSNNSLHDIWLQPVDISVPGVFEALIVPQCGIRQGQRSSADAPCARQYAQQGTR